MQPLVFSFISKSLLSGSSSLKNPAIYQKFHLSAINMALKVGDSIPDANLDENTPQTKVNIANEIKGKKVIIFAVPGAFTPGCSNSHLPSFLEKEQEFKTQKGINEIICVAVNDAFVHSAWGEHQKATGKIRFLADPNLEFTKKIGMERDIPPLGGLRSKRYAMVVEDGKVTQLNVEADGTGLQCSLAQHLKL